MPQRFGKSAVSTIVEMTSAVRHSLNEAFTWVRRQPPFRGITAEQAAAYDELGYFVVEGAFGPETVAEVMAEIDPIEREFEDLLRQAEKELHEAVEAAKAAK